MVRADHKLAGLEIEGLFSVNLYADVFHHVDERQGRAVALGEQDRRFQNRFIGVA